jgi:hypothetical protein
VQEAEEDVAGMADQAGQQDLVPGGGEFAGVLELMPGLAPTMPARTTRVTTLRASASTPLRTKFLCRTTVAQTAASQSSRPKVPM